MHNAAQDATQTTHDAIDTVWRLEASKLIGTVARLTHDVGASEKLAADAPVAALEQWRQDGVPTNPGAWLTTTAKRRALEWLRHPSMAAAEHEALARVPFARPPPHACGCRCTKPPGAAHGAGPQPVGPAVDPSWPGGAGASRSLAWAAPTRRARSGCAPPNSPATRANASCCSNARTTPRLKEAFMNVHVDGFVVKLKPLTEEQP